MEYDQFWAWMEFNRLSTFLPEREDWRNSRLLSKLHNVNSTKESHLTTLNDFMPPSIDEIIEKEMQVELEAESETNQDAAVHSFNAYVKRLKASARPVNTTIKL